MNAGVVGIWNMALSHLGDRANISDPNEQSEQAEQCRLFFPISVAEALAAAAWTFATSRAQLASLAARDTFNWRFAYAMPPQCLRIISVGSGQSNSWDDTSPYEVMSDSRGAPAIFCDVDRATAVYVRTENNIALFSPQFTSALVLLLASHLAGTLVRGQGGVQMKKALYELYRVELSHAAVLDANQRNNRLDFVSSGIAARA
jgi:hypothetical protein